MNVASLAPYVDVVSLITAGLVAFGYAAYLTTWVSRRIFPRVPRLTWWQAGLASAAVALPLAFASGVPQMYLFVAALVPVALLSAYVDARSLRIPNVYVVHGSLITLHAGFYLLLAGPGGSVWDAAVAWSAVLAGGTFLTLLGINLGSGGKLGMGDVKLGPVLAGSLVLVEVRSWGGALLASPAVVFLMLLVVFVWSTGSFMAGGVWILIRGTKRLKNGFPFGPFMVVSWIAAIACTPLIDRYLISLT